MGKLIKLSALALPLISISNLSIASSSLVADVSNFTAMQQTLLGAESASLVSEALPLPPFWFAVFIALMGMLLVVRVERDPEDINTH